MDVKSLFWDSKMDKFKSYFFSIDDSNNQNSFGLLKDFTATLNRVEQGA